MNRKSIYATLFLTFLLGLGVQTALAHTGGLDAGYRDNQTAASLIQAGEAEGAKILAAQAETSLLHLDEDAVLYATIANQSQTMMARPAVVCTWNGKLVGKTVLSNGLKGLDQQTVAIHISAADLDKVLGEDAKKGAIRLELIQDVNGEPTATKIIDGQKVSFPYQLDVTGADGVSTGTIYLYEETDGNYQQLGTYTVTFKKAD